MGITDDLEESSFVGLVGLEKVSERMEELDLGSVDTLGWFVLQRERKKWGSTWRQKQGQGFVCA